MRVISPKRSLLPGCDCFPAGCPIPVRNSTLGPKLRRIDDIERLGRLVRNYVLFCAIANGAMLSISRQKISVIGSAFLIFVSLIVANTISE